MKKNRSKNGIDRREFLSYSTAAGAGLFMSGISKAHGSVRQTNDLNIALLGSGAQGQVLLNSCLKIPGIRFKAVCDIWKDYNLKRATGLLKKYGHEVNDYEDYREMLANEKDLDAVIIATPDFWHAEHTISSLNAGLHVYCEKEMSNSLDEARQMVMAAKRTGKLLQIGHQRRSNPRYIHCREKLIQEAKVLGRITTINAQWNRSVQPDLGWPKKYAIPPAILRKYGFDSMDQFKNWRWYRRLGGGPIVDLGSHQIDIFSWFLDAMPVSVMASGGTDYYDKKSHEWYDTVMAIYEFNTEEGIIRAYYQTLTTNSNQGYYEAFMGDQGTLLISESAGRGGVYREQTAPQWNKWVDLGYLVAPVEEIATDVNLVLDVRETIAPPQHKLPVVFNDPYHKPHLENFFNTVRGNEELNCPAEAGYETAVAVLKVNQAVEAGRKLRFDKNEFTI
ncbi:Gfo/Idh/MocA family oxidoreductase [candidate division KSB1 bacterium]